MRVAVKVVVAALVATAVQVTAPVATAAPVSCSGTAKVFFGRADGTMWYYEHRAPATGAVSWTAGRQIGAGFHGLTVASTNGTIYYVTSAGELRRYRYDGTRWTDGAGTVVGTGWQDLPTFGRISVDSQGRLFAADGNGVLRVFDQSVPRWDLRNGIPLDTGWFGAPFTGGDNVFYRVESSGGDLYRYRYDPDAQRLTRSAGRVGTGFGVFEEVFSPGGDVLYAVPRNGTDLYWYRYDADAGTWANGGAGRVIGSGFGGGAGLSATTNTCSVPAPPPVGAVTPAPADPARAYQLSGDDLDGNFQFTFLGAGNRPHVADGEPWRPRVLADRTFASDLSATSSSREAMMVAGIDSTGQAWLAQDQRLSANFMPFGRGLTKLAFTKPTGPHAAVNAMATDPDGRLWSRGQVWTGDTGYRWTAWRQVFAGEAFRGFNDIAHLAISKTYGTASLPGSDRADRWFVIDREPQFGPVFRTGVVPAAADFDVPAVADTVDGPMALVARHRASGQPYVLRGNADGTGFAAAWAPLPPLSADGSVTLSTLPMSAAQWRGALAVVAQGSDGYVYVTCEQLRSTEFFPWQRLGEPAANAPALSVPNLFEAHVVFLGRDGKRYVFADNRGPSGSPPLVLTGGGWS